MKAVRSNDLGGATRLDDDTRAANGLAFFREHKDQLVPEWRSRIARAPTFNIGDGQNCAVTLATGAGGYFAGCKMLGINPTGPDAKALGFYPYERPRGADWSARNAETNRLTVAFRRRIPATA